MALLRKQDSFKRILLIVFALAFGVAALAVVFKASTSGTDIRSRAALEGVLYKAWEFDGKTTEGWDVNDPHVIVVRNGSLNLSVKSADRTPFIRNKTVDTKLPKGNKYISIVIGGSPQPTVKTPPPLPTGSSGGFGDFQGVSTEEDMEYEKSVEAGIVCATDTTVCPGGNVVGRVSPKCEFAPCGDQPLTMNLSYKLAGKDVWEKPIRLKADLGKKQYTLKAKLAEIGAIEIERIRFTVVAGVSLGSVVTIGSIHITGAKDIGVTPTVTPTPPSTTCIPRPACADLMSSVGTPSCVPKTGEVWCPKSRPTIVPTTPGVGGRGGVVCTQEAKKCLDGSYVSRTGPNCEFAPCPDTTQ